MRFSRCFMRFPRRRSLRTAGALAAACMAAAASAASLPAAQAVPAARPYAAVPPPMLSLIVAQRVITAQKYGKQVYFDPGVYVGAAHAPLQIDVGRQSYTSPVTVTQIIHLGGGRMRRRQLPAWVNDNWNGLTGFLHLTLRTSKGKLVLSQNAAFCPADGSAQKTGPGSPQNPLFPQDGCGSHDPFPRGEVWGIQRGWAVDPFYLNGIMTTLKLGTYYATVQINPRYVQMFHVAAPQAVGRVTVKVVNGVGGGPSNRGPAASASPRALPSLPQVPLLKHPPRDVLPDLIPLPAWGIYVQHYPGSKGHPGTDLLTFNGTVWIGGNGPLDVEGFRRNASPIMPAYQYFWHNGRVIGRVRAGTMGFGKTGTGVWHFQQFASYRLLKADKKLELNSGKVGFCIAPTDPVDMLLGNSVWNPQNLGFGRGECGSTSALWVQEELPVGWGDTYVQYGAGQAFTINNVPNGTYYIETIANPEHVLRETNTANDVTLRKIILGGTPGHRTVKVPAWHGIDPES
jgi:hypothetical protein